MATQVLVCMWALLFLVAANRPLSLLGVVSGGPCGYLQHEMCLGVMLQRLLSLCVICVECCDYLQMTL